jgi:hypothetical protein
MAFNYSLGVDPLSSSIRTLAPPSSRAMRKLSKEREFILYWVTRRATFEPPRCLSHCSRRSSLTSPAARAAPTEVFPLAGSGYRMICENFEWFNDSPVELPVRSRQNPLPPKKLCLSFADGNLSKLARQIQIHHSNIRDWMMQKQSPSLSSLLRLSAVFGVPGLDWVTKSIEFTGTCFSALGLAAPKRPLRRCHLPAARAELESLINSHSLP